MLGFKYHTRVENVNIKINKSLLWTTKVVLFFVVRKKHGGVRRVLGR